jgi:hypothetical protein
MLGVQEKEVLVKNIKRRMQYWHARKMELEQEEQVRYSCRARLLEFQVGLSTLPCGREYVIALVCGRSE